MEDNISVAECEAYVSSPGKFEGEARYVPYYWHLVNEYGADDEEWDDDDNVVFVFLVNGDDKALFPELEIGKFVRLTEDDNGFVKEIKRD